jgi:hypothetical protein
MVPPEIIEDLRYFVAIWQLSAARDCLLSGKRDTAMKLLEYSRGTRSSGGSSAWPLIYLETFIIYFGKLNIFFKTIIAFALKNLV